MKIWGGSGADQRGEMRAILEEGWWEVEELEQEQENIGGKGWRVILTFLLCEIFCFLLYNFWSVSKRCIFY